MLGPDKNGEFKEVSVKSIHCWKVPVKEIRSGQIAAIALKIPESTMEWLGTKSIWKGMVLVNDPEPVACWTFSAEVWPLNGET